MAEAANITLPGAPNQPVPGLAGSGAIQGGLMRPGSIDQSQFQQLLAAQRQASEAATVQPGLTLDDYRKLAGAPRQSVATVPAAAAPPLPAGDGIPTLSAEQFAVLTGMTLPDDPAPAPELPQPASDLPLGAPLEMVPEQVADSAGSNPDMDEPAPLSDADGVPVLDPVEVTAPRETPSAAPASESDDSRVVWFDSVPDRDDRRMLEASGKKWRVRETPGANELFMGPDGKFGWDDFVDIINPLQHIPVVAQIYRAVTGDQAYALSQFVGALPFGPISVASAVVDTMVRAQSGRDAGTDLAAAVLGVDQRTPEEANLHLVRSNSSDLAAGPAGDTAPLQSAATPAAPLPPSAWTRESSGNLGAAG